MACVSARTDAIQPLHLPCCRYQGGRTFDDFLKFLEDQLEADKGFARSPALDVIATSWLTASAGDGQDSLIAKVLSIRHTLGHESGSGTMSLSNLVPPAAIFPSFADIRRRRALQAAEIVSGLADDAKSSGALYGKYMAKAAAKVRSE